MTGFLGGSAIDIHTHVYPEAYVALLRARTSVPRIITRDGLDRMLILPGEDHDLSTATGRPLGSEYWDPARKLAYMDKHGIDVSVLSPANPWLDFLDADEAGPAAASINEGMEALAAGGNGRLYGMGLLPRDAALAAAELDRIAGLPHLRGAAIGTTGAGQGLDDKAMDPVWEAAERTGAMIFVHPHYGLGVEHMRGYGHGMLLALGFPFETTTAITRLILGGTFDRFPGLKVMVAHSGGALPYLAGRLDACVGDHLDPNIKLKQEPSAYLRMMYFDAISYSVPTLELLISLVGVDRLMFGTDHPFFPPAVPNAELESTEWHSPVAHRPVLAALGEAAGTAILRGNARRIFGLP
jgi:predicted TIM-barrel fold metal-dependent hydrolase